jgi:hypothetical protein
MAASFARTIPISRPSASGPAHAMQPVNPARTAMPRKSPCPKCLTTLKANDRYRVVCISASALAVRMNEADNFIRCQACGSWIDCRDLGSVFDHEGPLPHPDRAHLESRGYFAQLTALPASRHCHTHDQQRVAPYFRCSYIEKAWQTAAVRARTQLIHMRRN